MMPLKSKTAPLTSATVQTIHNKAKEMDGWVEHYSELYLHENNVSEAALNFIEPLL